MKLISCHINGFGCLTNYDVDFDGSLHCEQRPNGAGKSTLLHFIRVMLYGMPTVRSNDSGLKDRTHYVPFGGGPFGGRLVIEAAGKRYYIERTFDKTSATKDTCRVLDGRSHDVTADIADGNVGMHFFQLDEDAFQRTVFFTGQTFDDGAGNNETIRQGLNASTNGVSPAQLERALKELKRQKDDIVSKTRGRLSLLEREYTAIEEALHRLETLAATLPEHYRQLEQLQHEHREKQRLVDQLHRNETLCARWETYDQMQAELTSRMGERRSIAERYPGGIPSAEQTNTIRSHAQQAAEAVAVLRTLSFPEGSRQRLKALETRYPQANPRAHVRRGAMPFLVVTGLLALTGVGLLAMGQWHEGAVLLAIVVALAVVVWRWHTARAKELAQLRAELAELETLRQQHADYQTKERQHAEQRDVHRRAIALLYEQCGLELPEDVLAAVAVYDHERERLAHLDDVIALQAQACEEFSQTYHLTERPALMARAEAEELRESEERLHGSITLLSTEIERVEEEVAECNDLRERLSELEAERKALKEQKEVIERTSQLLVQANTRLLDRYVAPIRGQYQSIMQRLMPRLAHITLDEMYNPSFQQDANDTPHPCGHLSQGERTCLEMGMRLALVENVFSKERPFLVMDDPFVHLDAANLQMAKEMLRQLSQHTQVLYFCCSAERAI